MNYVITVEDCLCLTDPNRDSPIFAVSIGTSFIGQFRPAQALYRYYYDLAVLMVHYCTRNHYDTGNGTAVGSRLGIHIG